MQKAEKRLTAILKRAEQAGIAIEMITQFVSQEVNKLETKNTSKSTYPEKCATSKKDITKKKLCSVLLIMLGILVTAGRSLYSFMDQSDSECLVKMPFDATKVFRKPEDCSLCKGINSVDRVSNISQNAFDEFYASIAKPVIVTDGTSDWSSQNLFSFNFFKELYQKYEGGKTVCQFFRYKTEFESLKEVLNMSEARARLEPGTNGWYVGWSNCNDRAGQELRKHYKRPYFLPDVSENMALSWIFMGGPGEGAHMHVDNVHYASWQAQLRGRKKWRLAPPPECHYACAEFSATVEPGEIIVVDTNRWYHQTHILPGDISITIGTEFD